MLDVKTGRVHYWDHEEGAVEPEPVAASLAELVSRILDRRQAAQRGDVAIAKKRAKEPKRAREPKYAKEEKAFKSLPRDGKDTIARADLGKLLASLGTPQHLAAANGVIDFLKQYRIGGPPADRVSWSEFEAWLKSEKPDE